MLLLTGLCWISLGVGASAVSSAVLAYPSKAAAEIPPGMQWTGVAPVAIGLSHLVVYLVGKRNRA